MVLAESIEVQPTAWLLLRDPQMGQEAFGSLLNDTAKLPLSTIALRLLVASAIGALVGWDRQRMDKPAGLRTHMLVALGSASFVLLGFEVAERLAEVSGREFDPTRVLQGVIGGIGFLGAGSIIKGKGRVSGVTTAASVWVCGSLGAAVGMGAYVVALIAATITLVTLAALGKLEAKFQGRSKEQRANSKADQQPKPPDPKSMNR